MTTSNIIDRVVSFFSPVAGANRIVGRAQIEYLNQLEPLKAGRRGYGSNPSNQGGAEREVDARDRKTMHQIVSTMARENPLLKGLQERIVSNVVPVDGIQPNAITDDSKFNDSAEDYFRNRAEKCEVTNRFSFAQYQNILLRAVIQKGDFISVFTNQDKIQGIEADRMVTPQKHAKHENTKVFQGVHVTPWGAPRGYYIGKNDRYGNIDQKSFRYIQARNVIHSFSLDRIEQYRGISAFLPVLDTLRDVQEILQYEKFTIKMLSCMGIKIKPAAGAGQAKLPFPTSGTNTLKDGKQQEVKSLYAGQIFNLGNMGAEDIEAIGHDRPGNNFESIITLLCRLAGVGIGLPIELVLLDFHRGNMASVRAAMLEARRTFYAHYAVVKSFSQAYYRWVISQGVKRGDLKVTNKIRDHYWRAEWTEPVWNWLDPENEIKAEGMAIDLGLKTGTEACKQRGKDFQKNVEQRGKEIKLMEENKVPVVVGMPGTKTTEDSKNKEKKEDKNNDKNISK